MPGCLRRLPEAQDERLRQRSPCRRLVPHARHASSSPCTSAWCRTGLQVALERARVSAPRGERRRLDADLVHPRAVRAEAPSRLPVTSRGVSSVDDETRDARPRRTGRRSRTRRWIARRASTSPRAAALVGERPHDRVYVGAAASSRSATAQSSYASSSRKSPVYDASAATRRACAVRLPARRSASASSAAARNPSTSTEKCSDWSHTAVLSAPTKWSGPMALLGVEDGPDGAEQHGQAVAERAAALVGPERLHQRVARDRAASPGDEDLEQVARLARLPGRERDGLARPRSTRNRPSDWTTTERDARRGGWTSASAERYPRAPWRAADRRPDRALGRLVAVERAATRSVSTRASPAGLPRSRQIVSASLEPLDVSCVGPGAASAAELERLGEHRTVARGAGRRRGFRRVLGARAVAVAARERDPPGGEQRLCMVHPRPERESALDEPLRLVRLVRDETSARGRSATGRAPGRRPPPPPARPPPRTRRGRAPLPRMR